MSVPQLPSWRTDAGESARIPFALAFAAALTVLALKAPDALLVPQFWAEDGAVFFVRQLPTGVPQLFDPYAGYLHFLPRLTAWAASGFSSVYAPWIYNLAALAIGAASLVSLRQLEALGVTFLLALAPIALVPTNGEIWGTITNVQWMTQFYLLSTLVRLFHAGEDHSMPLIRVSIAIAVGLSGPFVIFAVLAALAGTAWMRWHTKAQSMQRRSKAAPIPGEWMALGLCAIVQSLTIVATSQPSEKVPFSLHPYWVFLQSLQLHTFGAQLMPTALFLVLVCALLWLALRKANLSQQASLLAIACFVALQLAAAAHKAAGQPEALLAFGNGDRYYLVFKVAFWWLAAIAIARNVPRAGHAVCAGIMTVLLGINAAAMPDKLRRAAFQDLHWADYARRIDAGEAVEVPINPVPWRFQVPARGAQ